MAVDVDSGVSIDTLMPIGKYKGAPLAAVMADNDYRNWLTGLHGHVIPIRIKTRRLKSSNSLQYVNLEEASQTQAPGIL